MPVELQIESLVAGGDGLAHHEGRAVFVPGTLPGDRVRVDLEQARGALRGRLVEVVSPSADRVAPGCPHAEACGGCQWLGFETRAQQRAREEIFYAALSRIGGLERSSFDARPIAASDSPLRYRSRTKLHVAGGRLGYSARASHRVVPIDECRLLQPRLEDAVLRLQAALGEQGAPPRCAEVSLACDERHVAAAFHIAGPGRAALARAARLVERARLDGGVVAAEGEPARTVGRPILSWPAPCAPGVALHGRPDLFAQANTASNARLVEAALEGVGAAASVLELYCGAGNFTFALAQNGREVTASEIAGEALELARRSAREAKLPVRFVAGDALAVAKGFAREGRGFDALVLDPPRTGARGIGRVAAALAVPRVVYVSCDPATLARDARELIDAGYRAVRAVPVDMFPQTFHVEGVLVLERA